MKIPLIFGMFLAFLLLSACGTVGSKVAEIAAKPVFAFAVEDATTTNLWIDREVKSGRLSATEELIARACPNAVLELDALRTRLAGAEGPLAIKGKKGLIYLGTVARFTKSIKTQAVTFTQHLIGACAPLVPAEKLLGMF